MKPLAFVGLFVITLARCAPARTGPGPAAPAPVPAEPARSPATPPPTTPPATPPADSASRPAPAPAAAPARREAPRNWQLLDAAADRVPGTSAERAYRELLAGRQPKRTVVVAVIDGGVDTTHADLRANLWANPKEVVANGRDDDNNGYADDVRGWNFIGGRDGRDVQYDTYEVARLHGRCTGASKSALPVPSAERCRAIAADFARRRAEAEQQAAQVRQIGGVLAQVLPLLKQAAGSDSLTAERVGALRPTDAATQRAQQVYLQLAAAGISAADVEEARKSLESQLKYGLDPAFDPRPIVGDNYANTAERRYGNTSVVGPDAGHGTHVAGIIAAVRGNNLGVDGLAPAVRVMAVRAVPDGDERDKDVANAIRYAVDNGARVINMSFGKAYSPYKSAVDSAVRYADARGVLMVHAAGNDGQDISREPNFPTPAYTGGGRAANWIEVGASSWRGDSSLAAPFSNYSRTEVDVFAPGVDILSTAPAGTYERQSGTSMAAPVVSGLAATIMAYYPSLTAADVKRVILASATRHGAQMVAQPGSPNGARVPFASLSATGAVVNLYAALRMAEEMSAPKP